MFWYVLRSADGPIGPSALFLGQLDKYIITALSDYQPDAGRVAIRVAKDREPRFVPIYGDVIAVINDWLKVRLKDCPSDYLFVSDRGLQMSVNTWAKEFKKHAVAAGMAEITPRSLRHFGLTLMAETNLLAAAAGHSSLSTTRGYLHNNFAYTRAALAKAAHLDMTGLEDGRRKNASFDNASFDAGSILQGLLFLDQQSRQWRGRQSA